MTAEIRTASLTNRFNPLLTQHQAMVTFSWSNQSVSFDPGVYGEPPKVSGLGLSNDQAVLDLIQRLREFADDLSLLEKEVREVVSALDRVNRS